MMENVNQKNVYQREATKYLLIASKSIDLPGNERKDYCFFYIMKYAIE